jgi:hypothetical protein
MCCGSRSHHSGRHCGPGHRGRHHRGPCACGQPFGFERRFWAREERIAWLEEYLEKLRAEAKAVEEQIAEMKERA